MGEAQSKPTKNMGNWPKQLTLAPTEVEKKKQESGGSCTEDIQKTFRSPDQGDRRAGKRG